jgi:hypothetical protein
MGINTSLEIEDIHSVGLPIVVRSESQLVSDVNWTFFSVCNDAEVTCNVLISSPEFQVDVVGCSHFQCIGVTRVKVVVAFIVVCLL